MVFAPHHLDPRPNAAITNGVTMQPTDWLCCPYERGDYIDLPRLGVSGEVVATKHARQRKGRRAWAITIRTDAGSLVTEWAGYCEEVMGAAEIAERASMVRAEWDAVEKKKRWVGHCSLSFSNA